MSTKRQQLLELFLNQSAPIQVYRASVVSIETGNRCTVKLFGSDLVVSDVTLIAEEDAGQWFCVTPKIGSIVLVGAVNNQVSDMYLVQYGEVEKIDILIAETALKFGKDSISIKTSNSSVFLDQDKITVTQGKTVVELTAGKVTIKNEEVSLKSIFDDLSNLIQNLKVVTSTGPSTALFADTIASLAAFKLKYPKLLS
jgi:hypothetical protein